MSKKTLHKHLFFHDTHSTFYITTSERVQLRLLSQETDLSPGPLSQVGNSFLSPTTIWLAAQAHLDSQKLNVLALPFLRDFKK